MKDQLDFLSAQALLRMIQGGTLIIMNPPAANASVNLTQEGGIAVAATAKGIQATNFLNAQDAKDTGRTFIIANALRIAGVTAEALLSFVVNKGGTNQGSATSYTVTAGKTLRLAGLTVVCAQYAGTAAIQNVSCRVRAAAAVLATSPIVGFCEAFMTAATLQTGAQQHVDLPDGVEIAGGQQVGISQLASATTVALSVLLYGFEY